MRALDRKGIDVGTEADVERLDRAVGDAAAHAQTRDRRGRQRAGVRRGIAGVVHVQHVATADRTVAVDRQQGIDAVDGTGGGRRQAANIDSVRIVAAVGREDAADGAHVDDVFTAITVQGRATAGTGPIDDHGVGITFAVHHQLIGNIIDDDQIGAVAGVQGCRFSRACGRAIVGAVDGKDIRTTAERDHQVFDIAVVDT